MNWMPYIHILIFGVVAFLPEWRRTCLIIVFFAALNMAYQPLTNAAAADGNQNIHLIYVAADFITIMALLIWGKKGSLLQASVLTAFIAVNFALLLDYKAPPYPVYESYKEVIFALNIIQILLIGGGIYAVVKFFMDGLSRTILGRVRYSGFSSLRSRSGPRKHMDKVE